MTDQLDQAEQELHSRAVDFAGEERKQRPWLKPLIGVIALAVILFTAPIYGWLTSDGKIEPSVDREADFVDIEVIVPFDMEEYHRETLQGLGVYAGRLRDLSLQGARLRQVPQENVDKIANLFWVESIRPME